MWTTVTTKQQSQAATDCHLQHPFRALRNLWAFEATYGTGTQQHDPLHAVGLHHLADALGRLGVMGAGIWGDSNETD